MLWLTNLDHLICEEATFFREKKWSLDEMINPMFEIASNAIEFYIGAYGLDNLQKT